MSIEKIEEFAESGEKHLNNLDVKQGFQQAEKPERQWFNYLLNDYSKKINQVIDGLSDIDFEFDGFAPKISELESNYTEISSELTRVSDDFKSADAVLQGQIDGIGGGKFAYTTYAKMEAAAALPDEDPLKLPANSSIDVTNDTDPLKNGTYSYDGAVFAKSIYDVETIVRNKVLNTFKTKALMDASALPDGADAQVTDDTVNHGLYVKTAGAWVKSDYDPLTQAKSYTDEARDYTESLVEHNSNDYLEIRVDANGNLYSATNAEGGLLLPDVEGTLQDAIRPLKQDKSNASLRILGSNDLDVLLLSETGALHVDDVVNKYGALSSQLAKVSSTARDTSYDVAYKTHETIDGMASYGDTPSNVQHVLADASEYPPNESLFGASIARTGKYTYYLSYDVRETGHDYDDIFLVGRTVTFDPVNRTFLSGTSTLLANAGTATSGLPYAHLNPTVSCIEFGANAGRILVHFNYMEVDVNDLFNNIYRPCYVYSDDGGANFSDVIYMDSMFPMADWGDILNFGTGHGIQIQSGVHKGRLVLSAYHRHPRAIGTSDRKSFASRVIYSDDGGDTYQAGALLDSPQSLSEWQVVNAFDGGLVGLARIGSNNPEKYIAYSYDGGMTFSEPQIVDKIRGAGIKIGFAQIANNYDYSTPKLIASCPSDPDEAGNVRRDAAVWVSYDDGKTFPHKQQVDLGVAQYSDVASLDEHSILYIYCGGTDSRGNQVLAHILNLKFLLEK